MLINWFQGQKLVFAACWGPPLKAKQHLKIIILQKSQSLKVKWFNSELANHPCSWIKSPNNQSLTWTESQKHPCAIKRVFHYVCKVILHPDLKGGHLLCPADRGKRKQGLGQLTRWGAYWAKLTVGTGPLLMPEIFSYEMALRSHFRAMAPITACICFKTVLDYAQQELLP